MYLSCDLYVQYKKTFSKDILTQLSLFRFLCIFFTASHIHQRVKFTHWVVMEMESSLISHLHDNWANPIHWWRSWCRSLKLQRRKLVSVSSVKIMFWQTTFPNVINELLCLYLGWLPAVKYICIFFTARILFLNNIL